jgi:hypothetical protein
MNAEHDGKRAADTTSVRLRIFSFLKIPLQYAKQMCAKVHTAREQKCTLKKQFLRNCRVRLGASPPTSQSCRSQQQTSESHRQSAP